MACAFAGATSVCFTMLTGCTLEPTPDGVTFVPRAPYRSEVRDIAESPWNGQPIEVDVERGNIEVIGKAGGTSLRVRALAYTWSKKREDASSMLAATLATAKVTRDARGGYTIRCEVPKQDIGSAANEVTQCNVRVEIPAPERVVHDIRAIARFGDVTLQRLQSGPQTRIVASGIEVEGYLLRGNVEVQSYWADVEVEPRPGSDVLVASASDDWYYLPTLEAVEKRDERDGAAKFGATLRIPKDFTAERVTITSRGAAVEAFAFPDVESGAPRLPLGPTSARSVTVTANQGNATLLPMGETITVSRTGDFGLDAREPWLEND
jgi:hypothetical protein